MQFVNPNDDDEEEIPSEKFPHLTSFGVDSESLCCQKGFRAKIKERQNDQIKIEQIIRLFNSSKPKKAAALLAQWRPTNEERAGFSLEDSQALQFGQFLHTEGFDKAMMGEYFGAAESFNSLVFRHFLSVFYFKTFTIEHSLRQVI